MRHSRALGGDSGAFGIRFELVLLRTGQQPVAQVELGDAITVGEEAVVADAMETVGSVCRRKRRMNSCASSVMIFVLPRWR